jgi:WD40 repeat protein
MTSRDRTNPFPGLRPFDVNEYNLFFGRADQIDELLRRLHGSRFTAVVGTSGSGKSSLVRAGLLAALKRGLMSGMGSRWRVALFRPINDPFGNLTRALHKANVLPPEPPTYEKGQLELIEETLRSSSYGLIETVRQAHMGADENLLVVVDQFEELFRFKETFECESPADEAAAFVKLLLEATRQRALPIYLVLTMRSDYLGESAKFGGLPEAINEGQYLVPRMSDDERRAAITEPAAIGGAQITEPLVNRLLNHVGDDPDNLPLLQHALRRIWENWARTDADSGEPLTIRHYEAIGELTLAVSNHANEAFEDLSEAQRFVAERVFKALTAKGPDGRGIRAPRKFGELCAIAATNNVSAEAVEPDVRAVVEAYRREDRSFLMPPPGESLAPDTLVDISHETLIQGWGKLKDWVNEEADDVRTYQHLVYSAILFDKGRGNLLAPPALTVSLDWRDSRQPNESWARRYFNKDWEKYFREGGAEASAYANEFERANAFLDESRKAHEAAVIAEEERKRELAVAEEAHKRKLAVAEEAHKRELAEARHQLALASERQRRFRLLKWGVAALAVLSLFAVGAAAFAGMQWGRANSALAAARQAQQDAEAARQTAESAKRDAETAVAETQRQLEKTNEAKEEAEQQKNEVELQKQLAEQAKEEAVGAKAEAETQRDAARNAEAAAVKSKEQALAAKKAADLARMEADEQRKEAEDQRVKALFASMEAVQQRTRAEVALIQLEELRRQEGQQATKEVQKVRASLRNVDSKTPHFGEVIRHDQPVSIATFNAAGDRILTASTDGQGYWVDKVGEDEFGAQEKILNPAPRPFSKDDFVSLAGFVTDLKGKLYQTSGSLVNRGTLSPDTAELLDKYTPRSEPDPQLVEGIINDLNNVVRGPSLSDYAPKRKRAETQQLAEQNPQGDDLRRLNRMILEDAYPDYIKPDPLLPLLSDKTAKVYAYSPDGTLAALVKGGEMVLLKLKGGPQVTLEGAAGNVNNVAFSPKGGYVVSTANDDNLVRIWDATTGKPVRPAIELGKPASLVVFSPDGKYLAAATPDSGEFRIWDIDEPTAVVKVPRKEGDFGKGSAFNSIAFNKGGTLVVTTVKGENDAKVWDAKTGELKLTLHKHSCQVNSAEFNPDGSKIVTAGDDGAAFIWNAASGKIEYELRGHKRLVISHTKPGGFFSWISISPPVKFDLERKEGEYVPLNTARFSPDGSKVVTASVDGSVRVWTWEEGKKFANLPLELQGYTGNVTDAEFSPDSKLIIAAGDDGAARIWKVGSGRPDKEPAQESCEEAKKIRVQYTRP